MSDPLGDALDCRRCGACCTSPSARHVPVTGADYEALGDRAEELTDWTESHAFMRMTGGHCIALSIEPDSVRCTIYETRPEICRALERGGPACEVERAHKLPIVR